MSEEITRKLALARNYRPQNFAQLIGQDAMVQVLKNAFIQGRIAQAYILTGVRGVGKTTTARIIAKALNCVQSTKGVLADPCGICENCVAIANDRHIDVMEMDAATHTKVEEMRDLLATVQYAPSLGKYKVYILDEVHMLSQSSFNAMLKTLEEPPAHIVFLFATTEIRKVPLTILSRCQRFDLRRVSESELSLHYQKICDAENITIDADALQMIARAADGSVRDGLSVLDQAIALSQGHISTESIISMLGLNDRSKIWELFVQICQGNAEKLLADYQELIAFGAEPRHIFTDLSEAVHLLTKANLLKSTAQLKSAGEIDKKYCQELMGKVGLSDSTRIWQVLLKSLQEIAIAPDAIIAGEMILIRLLLINNSPSPLEIIKKIQYQNLSAHNAPALPSESAMRHSNPQNQVVGNVVMQNAPLGKSAQQSLIISDFAQIVALAKAQEEMILATNLTNNVHLVKLTHELNQAGEMVGHLEFRPADEAPANLAQECKKFLQKITQNPWNISLVREGGADSLRQQLQQKKADELAKIQENDEVIANIYKFFPKANIISIKEI